MWLARDTNGDLCIYNTKPIKDMYEWIIPNCTGDYCIIDEKLGAFPEVKWEDNEPRELVLKPIKDE